MKKIVASILMIILISLNISFAAYTDSGAFRYKIDLSEPVGFSITILDRNQQEIMIDPETGTYPITYRESDTEINQFYVNLSSTYLGDLNLTFSFSPFILKTSSDSGNMPNIGYTATAYDTTTYDNSASVIVKAEDRQMISMETMTIVRPENSLIDKTWGISFTDLDDYSGFIAGEYCATVKVEVSYVS